MYLFDLIKINCSINLIVKSLYHIIEMYKIKNFDILFLLKEVAILISLKLNFKISFRLKNFFLIYFYIFHQYIVYLAAYLDSKIDLKIKRLH